MQCVVACGEAVPWVMQVGLKRRHVVWGLSRRSTVAAAREFVQLRKHKTTSLDRFSFCERLIDERAIEGKPTRPTHAMALPHQ